MAQFDFTKTFEAIGLRFRQSLQNNVKRSQGIDGDSYSPPAPSTLRARRSRKSSTGKALKSSSSDKRLWVTGEFGGNAFEFKAFPNGVRVFAKETNHRSGITFADILRYNSKNQPKVNRNIKNPPLVFPTSQDEIMLMKSDWDFAKDRFAKDAKKQLVQLASINLKVKLTVG